MYKPVGHEEAPDVTGVALKDEELISIDFDSIGYVANDGQDGVLLEVKVSISMRASDLIEGAALLAVNEARRGIMSAVDKRVTEGVAELRTQLTQPGN